MTAERLTPEALETVIGPVDEGVAAAIIATGATVAEVEEALQFAFGQNDVMGEMGRSLSGRVEEVYKIMVVEELGAEGLSGSDD